MAWPSHQHWAHAPLTTSLLMQLAPGEAIQVLLCVLHSLRVSCYFHGGLEFSLFMKRRVQALSKHFPQHCWRLCFLVLLLTSIGTVCDWLFRRSSIFLRTTQPQRFVRQRQYLMTACVLPWSYLLQVPSGSGLIVFQSSKAHTHSHTA